VKNAQTNGFRGRIDPATLAFTPEGYELTISDEGTVIFRPR